MKPLNWNNLKRNKCPRCNKLLDFQSDQNIGSEVPMLLCTLACGFMISYSKFSEFCMAKSLHKIEQSYIENTNDYEQQGNNKSSQSD